MTTFVFTELVPTQNESAALGADKNGKLTDVDLGKPVKIAGSNNFVLCTGGDEIDGFVRAIEPFTVNDGFSFGGVMRKGRATVVVGANQGLTDMAVGDLVVADAQSAVGTAGAATVKTGAPTYAFWRCIRIVSGTGKAGDSVLIERL